MMEAFSGHYKHTKTTEFLIQLNKFVFIFGLPNYWVENLDFSDFFYRTYRQFNRIGNICITILFLSEFGAFFTQKNLTDKQFSNLVLFTFGQGIIIFFRFRMTHQKPNIRDVMFKLGIGLKEVYNDPEVEKKMIHKSKFFSMALVLNCTISLVLMTLEACMKTIRTGEPFDTIITFIPDTNDNSAISNILRAIFNIFWWMYLTRIFSVYSLVICLTSAMSHQYKNLNRYFWSLNDIFKDNLPTQQEMEEKYEEGLKVGIKMHADSLKCTDQIQSICKEVFSGQIIFNLILLIVLMYQMVNSDRNLANAITITVTAATILLSTGFFMWNAGDITVEADSLPTSIFCSGWENCRANCSTRVRKLIVISMMQAQKPVVLTGLGIIGLSYESYVSIVKSSYSVFSVIY